MGGKTKNTQRTKNNVKPSSSARSAELLGTAPIFVGFSAHSDLGLIPFAPGFATAERMPDTFDATISTPYQLTLKKMSKKDPMTKKKALQEFIDLINQSDLEEIKMILPLWPKFYHNLATDPEHNVRELTQTVLKILMQKCKKAMAPFLKQLVPVWLASQFDNYAPAASIASNNFSETFASNANRTMELCLHCQVEIVDYAMRNLTFHTAATLSTGKSLTPDEAEQKYQRIIICSLKELSFFVEHTASAEDQSQISELLQKLLEHQKFFTFAKSKVNAIKAAWFEFIYHLLQSPKLRNILQQHQAQLTSVSFKYIDESDPSVAPHVWGCVLLIQNNFKDWPQTIDFDKSVWPKFCSLLRNNFNRNAQAICPNILPFFAHVSQAAADPAIYEKYIREFFNILKTIIENDSLDNTSKQDKTIIIKTYFECLRYLMQKLNNSAKASEKIALEQQQFALEILETNIVTPLKWCFKQSNGIISRCYFINTSTVVAFFDKQQKDSNLYNKLLDKFWSLLFQITTEDLKQQEVEDLYVERLIQLVSDLYMANPCLEEHRVKFFIDTSNDMDEESSNAAKRPSTPKENHEAVAFRQKELKQLVLQLLRLCLHKTLTLKVSKYTKHVRLLCVMFDDKEFFANLSEEKTLEASLVFFIHLLKASFLDDSASEIVLDLVFQILQYEEKQQRYDFINKELMNIPHHLIHTLLVQRLLSYPMCIEPEVRLILAQPQTSEIIAKIANDVVENNSTELFNILHKCFFQTDSGEILISSQTVNKILLTLSQPLTHAADYEESNTNVDACGRFVAQVMPVICSKENSSAEVQHEVFLRFFRVSLDKRYSDFISEDTLWEITTCWQDALSSQDIIIDDELLSKCAELVSQHAKREILTIPQIEIMAEAIAKLSTCSTEHIENVDERSLAIDKVLKSLLQYDEVAIEDLMNTCLFVESLKVAITPFSGLKKQIKQFDDLQQTLQQALLNLSTLCKLVCKTAKFPAKPENTDLNDDEITEDYCDPNENLLKVWSDYLQEELLKLINIAAAADSLLITTNLSNSNLESLCLELSELVQYLFKNSGELSVTLKELLLEQTASQQETAYCRSLPYLVNVEQYAQFDESSTLLLAEDLQEYFAGQKAFKAYTNAVQFLLPKLEAKTIGIQCHIMSCEPKEIWIKAATFRYLIENNFTLSYNEKNDEHIIAATVQFITDHADKLHTNKELMVYQGDIIKADLENILNAVEYMQLLSAVIQYIPYQLTIKNWDVIRIGLGHWILSVTKTLDKALETMDKKAIYFTLNVFKLFKALTTFFVKEKQKSSTELIKNVHEEWIEVFSKEVYLTLFRTFYRICQYQEIPSDFVNCWELFLIELADTMEYMDSGIVYAFCKVNQQITLDHLCNFLMKNLSTHVHALRIYSIRAIRQLTPYFVADDIEMYETKSEQIDKNEHCTIKLHVLNRFEDYLTRYDLPIQKYLKDFSFKLTEINEMPAIDRHEALSYLMLWECIINVCAKSPVSLRSLYTSWLHENKYEENLLHFLFRAMPADILKNHSTKQLNNEIFKGLTISEIKDSNLSLEKYVCSLYTEVLSKLPAVVRKWWNTSPSRQKTFVDTLTTNFVSPIICQEELMAIASKKDKHENMQVTVHTSSREVLAVYAIDEARMELVITLASNYPLGSVKVDCNKQIGGRYSSRNIAMQLTIFLTHQNGTIFDGLALWKNNLDKKFEGVEECYVCYTVIHQETCQLPKLTCKTCKKKFHGPCLYKWFTTSSKSTCPICRNVF